MLLSILRLLVSGRRLNEQLLRLLTGRGGLRIGIRVTGLERAARNLEVAAEAFEERGGQLRALQYLEPELLAIARNMVHVETGTLRSALRTRSYVGRPSAGGRDPALLQLYIDPTIVNPVRGLRAIEYAPYERARGGQHDFARRTFEHFRGRFPNRFLEYLTREIPSS